MESNWSFKLLGDLWSGELPTCSDLTRDTGVSLFLIALFLAAGVFGIKPSILQSVSIFEKNHLVDSLLTFQTHHHLWSSFLESRLLASRACCALASVWFSPGYLVNPA